MDQDRDIGQAVVEIVEVLEVHHCFVTFVFLWVVGCRGIVGDVRDYCQARDFELFDPGVVFCGSCCHDEIDAGEAAFGEAVDSAGLFDLGSFSLLYFSATRVGS